VLADVRCTRNFSTTLPAFVDVAHRQIPEQRRGGRLLSIRLTIPSINFEGPVLPRLADTGSMASESLAPGNMCLRKTLAALSEPGCITVHIRRTEGDTNHATRMA
jgi:hypothetical protein